MGTSTSQEARAYFKDLGKHIISFKYTGPEDDAAIDLAFNKSKADERKRWMENARLEDTVDHTVKKLTYTDFINKELIQYSVAANARAIPSVVDGLKPGQRKIMFSCFKRSLKAEIKVAQLSGYVAEHSAYHHGEMSLAMTIVGLAQDFVGANNVNLLEPIGQFGTRHQGGKDSASARYIFTKLSPLARLLFPEADDPLVGNLEDDGVKVEPEFYAPILPLALINGANGIGMGWSTFVPCYNPADLAEFVRILLDGLEPEGQLAPWFYGFKGKVVLDEASGNCTLTGIYKIVDENTLEITELPIGTWTGDYKEFIEGMMEGDKDAQMVSEYREHHSQGNIRFIITFKDGKLDEIRDNIEKKMKLISVMSLRNIVLFNSKGLISRYQGPKEIIKEFFGVRYQIYERRREHIIKILQEELNVLDNKVRFINRILDGSLDINNKKKTELEQILLEKGFTPQTKGVEQTDEE